MKTLINIIISSLVMLIFNSCAVHNERAFLAKYEFEDFSQFKGVNIFKRGTDKHNNPLLVMDAQHFINGTSKVGCYVVILDKKNYQVIETKWTLIENYVNADTIKLQKLAQTFMKYEIPRLNVDIQGNVFVYLADIETLALVQFINESELLKRSKETKWVNIKNNWYKSE